MEYRSFANLNADVKAWVLTLPRDIDVVVGMPRSGMLVASLVALYLDRPLLDVDGYLAERVPWGGARLAHRFTTPPTHALIVDDSVRSGKAIDEVRRRIARSPRRTRTSYGAVYITPTACKEVDYWHEIVREPRTFEWNLFHHPNLTRSCVDIDGVLCRDPTSEESDDGPRYEVFLRTVPAILVPGHEIGWLVTSRLEKYRDHTEDWLASNNIRYKHLVMRPAQSAEERLSARDHARRKADLYREVEGWVFIESDGRQASVIARRAGRAVFCTGTGVMIQPSPPGQL